MEPNGVGSAADGRGGPPHGSLRLPRLLRCTRGGHARDQRAGAPRPRRVRHRLGGARGCLDRPLRAGVARPVVARLLPRAAGGRRSRRLGRRRAAVRGVARPRVAARPARPGRGSPGARSAWRRGLSRRARRADDAERLRRPHLPRDARPPVGSAGQRGLCPVGQRPAPRREPTGLGDRPVPGDDAAALGTVRRGPAVPRALGEPGRGRRAGAPSRSLAARGDIRRAGVRDAAGRLPPRRGNPERPPRRVIPPRRRRLPHLPCDVRARRRKRRAGARTIDQVQRRPGPAARPGGRACGRAPRPPGPDGGGVRGGRDPRLAVVRAQPREDGVVRRRPRGDHGAGSGSFVSHCRGDAPCADVRCRRHVRPLALGDVHRRRAWCRARRGGPDPLAPRASEGPAYSCLPVWSPR